MARHTPGPWDVWVEHGEIFAVGPNTVNEPGSISGTRGQVCEVSQRDEDPEDDDDPWGPGPIARANAHLICAAPDLLRALKALLKSVDGVPCGPERQCRAAIAKAEGHPAPTRSAP